MQIEGRIFLVTGGGSGLGEATVREFAEAGANVVIADVNGDAGKDLAAKLGDKVRFVKTDVTKEEDAQAAVDAAREAFGGLHGAINCAGTASGERVAGKNGPHSLDSFKKVVDLNLNGTFNILRLAAEAMTGSEPNEDGERGVIVNTASVAAFDGQIGQAAYAASKGGVAAMTLPIARELARSGIRVATVAPGLFDTPLGSFLPQEAKDALEAQIPFPPRFGRPAEFAQFVRSIVENPMLNGEVIRLDGAIRMAPK